MFLTAAELCELTGYVYCSRQIEWLRQHNWKFEVTAQNRPKVARGYFDLRLGASKDATVSVSEGLAITARPNFQALNAIGK